MDDEPQGPKRTRRSFARAPQQIQRARELRQAATEAEQIAWRLLRSFRRDGFVFRRQQPVERYVVDFCCPEERLIIELDGSVHAHSPAKPRGIRSGKSGCGALGTRWRVFRTASS